MYLAKGPKPGGGWVLSREKEWGLHLAFPWGDLQGHPKGIGSEVWKGKSLEKTLENWKESRKGKERENWLEKG